MYLKNCSGMISAAMLGETQRCGAPIERPWATASQPGGVLAGVRFDPDGRIAFTWLRGEERAPVTERVVVPSSPR